MISLIFLVSFFAGGKLVVLLVRFLNDPCPTWDGNTTQSAILLQNNPTIHDLDGLGQVHHVSGKSFLFTHAK